MHLRPCARRRDARLPPRSCALRSFAAATIFMALVIFCVDLTELIRPRSSFSEALGSIVTLAPARSVRRARSKRRQTNCFLNSVDARRQRLSRLVVAGPWCRGSAMSTSAWLGRR